MLVQQQVKARTDIARHYTELTTVVGTKDAFIQTAYAKSEPENNHV